VQVPRYAAPPAVAAAVPAAAAAGAAAVVVTKKKRAWWWWLLWLLLALLLLLLLLGLLRGCTPDGGFSIERVLPGAAAPADVASAARGGTAPGEAIPEPGGPVGPGGTGVPGGPVSPSGVDGGGAQVPGVLPGADPTLPGASQPGMGLPPDTAASMPGVDSGIDSNPKTDPLKPGDDPKKDPKDDPKNDLKTDPTKDPAKDPNPDPTKDPNNPNKGQTNPPVPKPGEDPKAMKLPTDPKAANKMDFLEGDWKAGEGLSDPNTGQPLDLSVNFGKDGKGQVTLRRPDGTVCSGGVQGQMKGGKLAIEGNQSIPCAGGGSYGAPRIECGTTSRGQTECSGINKDGSRYNMEMKRK
jgi:hypothetical protein